MDYGDGAGNIVEENSSICSRIWMRSCLQCFDAVGWAAGRASGLYKIWGDGVGGHWLVRMDWHPAGWSVCLPPLIFLCAIKSRSSLLALAHPGGPGKRAVKRLCVCVCVCIPPPLYHHCPGKPVLAGSLCFLPPLGIGDTDFFYRPDALPVTQLTVSKHWRNLSPLTLTSGLTSSFLHPPPDSWRKEHFVPGLQRQ